MADRVRARLTVVLVNVLVFCVIAEAMALFAYYVDTGAFYYVDHRAYEVPAADTPQGRLTSEALHPYFGPTHKPGVRFELPDSLRPSAVAHSAPPPDLHTNNFGFVAPVDYPVTRSNDRQYFIGLFGGSVGLWFCNVGATRLVDDLRREPRFAGKELVPLCFSHEGYKQPQQLLVLTYFLEQGQPFDLVVNIDGFNDVALATINDEHGFDISMPSAQHIEPLINLANQSTLTPEKLRSLATIQQLRDRQAWLAARLQTTRLAAVHFVLDRWYRRTVSQYADEQGRFANLPSATAASSAIQVTSRTRERRGEALFADEADQWARASLLMQDLLAARGVPYVHVLQPNQYYTKRRFTEAEKAIAVSDASPFKRAVEQGYPALVIAAATLSRREHFVNGIDAFDRIADPVYMDNCCHYTRAGNYALADLIAREIVGAFNHGAPTRSTQHAGINTENK
jgi:hypothetical protein